MCLNVHVETIFGGDKVSKTLSMHMENLTRYGSQNEKEACLSGLFTFLPFNNSYMYFFCIMPVTVLFTSHLISGFPPQNKTNRSRLVDRA